MLITVSMPVKDSLEPANNAWAMIVRMAAGSVTMSMVLVMGMVVVMWMIMVIVFVTMIRIIVVVVVIVGMVVIVEVMTIMAVIMVVIAVTILSMVTDAGILEVVAGRTVVEIELKSRQNRLPTRRCFDLEDRREVLPFGQRPIRDQVAIFFGKG